MLLTFEGGKTKLTKCRKLKQRVEAQKINCIKFQMLPGFKLTPSSCCNVRNTLKKVQSNFAIIKLITKLDSLLWEGMAHSSQVVTEYAFPVRLANSSRNRSLNWSGWPALHPMGRNLPVLMTPVLAFPTAMKMTVATMAVKRDWRGRVKISLLKDWINF